MTLILRPIGRGNWRTTRMQIDGGHALPCCFASVSSYRSVG